MGKIVYAIHPDLKCVHFKGTGDISYPYLMENIMRVSSDPEFDFSYNTFVDFEDALVSARAGGLEEYHEFFQTLQSRSGRIRWAIYSRNKETLQNANMAHLPLTANIAVDVFDVKADALAYLGIEESQLDRIARWHPFAANT